MPAVQPYTPACRAASDSAGCCMAHGCTRLHTIWPLPQVCVPAASAVRGRSRCPAGRHRLQKPAPHPQGNRVHAGTHGVGVRGERGSWVVSWLVQGVPWEGRLSSRGGLCLGARRLQACCQVNLHALQGALLSGRRAGLRPGGLQFWPHLQLIERYLRGHDVPLAVLSTVVMRRKEDMRAQLAKWVARLARRLPGAPPAAGCPFQPGACLPQLEQRPARALCPPRAHQVLRRGAAHQPSRARSKHPPLPCRPAGSGTCPPAESC